MCHFKLIRIPAEKHKAPNGMSRQPKAPKDDDNSHDEENTEDWLDKMMSFAIVIMNSPAFNQNQVLVESSIPGHTVVTPYHGSHKGDGGSHFSTFFTSGQVYVNKTEGGNLNTGTEALLVADKTKRNEARLDLVKKWLADPLLHLDLPDKELRGLIVFASHFFLLDEKLMRRGIQGRHKVVPTLDHCLPLIEEAHKIVSHKGIFTTLQNLKEHLW
ncbi:hypothetical protein K439DRAFT_1619020 [Ramaria rubella]|nr:hypothetical protein K439DRAFT_1619020 [Ramaria rubella]